MTTKTLRIPLIIDANGKWCAIGYTALEQPGKQPEWPWLDEQADPYNPLVYPQRMWVTVTVELPIIGEVTGTAEPA